MDNTPTFWPLLDVVRGRATYSRGTGVHVGTCSMGERWQVRFDLYGWFVAFVFRKPKRK